jgi:WD40 repeat protein
VDPGGRAVRLVLWDVTTGAPVAVAETEFVSAELSVAPDGDLSRGVPTAELPWSAPSLAFSADGARLAIGEQIWSVDGVRQADLATVQVVDGQAMAIALDGVGMLLATGRRDGQIVLWDVASGIEMAELSASELTDQDQSITGLSFRPGDEALLSFTPIGRVVSWELDPRVWREQACRVTGRTLSEPESQLYLGDDAPARPCDP